MVEPHVHVFVSGEQHDYREFSEVLCFVAAYLPDQALLRERTAGEP